MGKLIRRSPKHFLHVPLCVLKSYLWNDFVYVIVYIVLLIFTFMYTPPQQQQKQRRHVSMEGERMAKRVVDNIAGEHLHDDHEQKVYYRYCTKNVSFCIYIVCVNNACVTVSCIGETLVSSLCDCCCVQCFSHILSVPAIVGC